MEIPRNFFLTTSRNSNSFLLDPCNFRMLFLKYPWKITALKPRLDIFWNSQILKHLQRPNAVTTL